MNFNLMKNKKPIATETGNWDGLRTGLLLVFTSRQTFHVVRMYEGGLDGREFCSFYDEYDVEIDRVVAWVELYSPI